MSISNRPRCDCVLCIDRRSLTAPSTPDPIFPSTVPASHQRIRELHALATAYESHMHNLRVEIQWLKHNMEAMQAAYQEMLTEKEAWQTRAETTESRLLSLEKAGRLVTHSLEVSPSAGCTLQLVYEYGALCLMKLVYARAPPHPRILIDDAVEHAVRSVVHGARPESRVDDQDATVVASAVLLTQMSQDQGHEADAHSRARDHQRNWIAACNSACGGGAAAGSLHYVDVARTGVASEGSSSSGALPAFGKM